MMVGGARRILRSIGAALLAVACLGGAAPLLAEEIAIPIIEPTDDPQTFLFNPTSDTVAMGDAVTWINSGRREHRALAEDGSFNSGPIPPGGRWTLTPSAPGVTAYFCPLYPEMRGTLTVRDDAEREPPARPSGAGSRRPAEPTAAAPSAPRSAPREVGPSPTGTAPRAGGLPLVAALPLILTGLASLLAGGTLLRQDLRAARLAASAPSGLIGSRVPSTAAAGSDAAEDLPSDEGGWLWLGPRGRCIAAEPAAAALLGRDAGELRGLPIADGLRVGPAWSAEERTRFVADGGWQGERAVRRADGTLATLVLRVEASLDGRGKLRYRIEVRPRSR